MSTPTQVIPVDSDDEATPIVELMSEVTDIEDNVNPQSIEVIDQKLSAYSEGEESLFDEDLPMFSTDTFMMLIHAHGVVHKIMEGFGANDKYLEILWSPLSDPLTKLMFTFHIPLAVTNVFGTRYRIELQDNNNMFVHWSVENKHNKIED